MRKKREKFRIEETCSVVIFSVPVMMVVERNGIGGEALKAKPN